MVDIETYFLYGGGQYVNGYGNETTQNHVVIGQPEVKMNMRVKRCYASSVALNQNTLWAWLC